MSSLIVKTIDQIGLLESLYLVDQLQSRLHSLFPHQIAKTADLSPVWQIDRFAILWKNAVYLQENTHGKVKTLLKSHFGMGVLL